MLLFGTGLGTAFHMWFAHLTGEPRVIAAVGRNVVLADWLFTAPAVIAQPVTGVLLALVVGHDLTELWILASIGLYLLAGACWLPVVWIQMRMARLARVAHLSGTPLPPDYFRLAWIWFALGWPAFVGLLVVFWLMIARPVW